MLVKSVFIELRARLRSCNVFITTGIDFTKNCNVKISIQANCIVLNYYDDRKKRRDSLSSIESLSDCSENESEQSCVIPIRDFQIIPNSMSCLKIDKNIISFRILSEPKNGGNFYKELLSANNFDTSSKGHLLKLNVKTNEDMEIICSNCSNVITGDRVKFDRILELPTANLDMSEWFCHGPGGHSHSGHSHDPSPVTSISPNKTDFLYRLTFFIVNNTILSEKTNKFNSKRDVYHCNRCLAWLGLKNKEIVKLFNSEIKIKQNTIEKFAFASKIALDVHTEDFIYTIERMTAEFNIGFQYSVMCRIVLECSITALKKQYLLIWVVDKELQVLRNCLDTILNDKIELQSTSVSKILYKTEFSLNDEVESWLSDPAVVSTDISKNMFNKGLAHFQKMSLKVPECFRNANGYLVTYLKV